MNIEIFLRRQLVSQAYFISLVPPPSYWVAKIARIQRIATLLHREKLKARQEIKSIAFIPCEMGLADRHMMQDIVDEGHTEAEDLHRLFSLGVW